MQQVKIAVIDTNDTTGKQNELFSSIKDSNNDFTNQGFRITNESLLNYDDLSFTLKTQVGNDLSMITAVAITTSNIDGDAPKFDVSMLNESDEVVSTHRMSQFLMVGMDGLTGAQNIKFHNFEDVEGDPEINVYVSTKKSTLVVEDPEVPCLCAYVFGIPKLEYVGQFDGSVRVHAYGNMINVTNATGVESSYELSWVIYNSGAIVSTGSASFGADDDTTMDIPSGMTGVINHIVTMDDGAKAQLTLMINAEIQGGGDPFAVVSPHRYELGDGVTGLSSADYDCPNATITAENPHITDGYTTNPAWYTPESASSASDTGNIFEGEIVTGESVSLVLDMGVDLQEWGDVPNDPALFVSGLKFTTIDCPE